MDDLKNLMKRLEEARAKGLPASTVNGCECDFCTGKKRHEDWCARCGNVRLRPDQSWENLDVCDECDKQITEERAVVQ